MHKVLLYTNKLNEIDDYARLVREAALSIELHVCRDEADVGAAIGDAEIIFGVHLPAHVYEKARNLKWIQSMWAGVERLLASPVPPRVIITKPWGVFGKYLSHYVFGNLLAQRVKYVHSQRLQSEKRWESYRIEALNGQTMGIAGMGDTAVDIAIAARAFGMRVYGMNSDGRAHPLAERMFSNSQLADFVADLDVLVLTLPATANTLNLFDQHVLGRMRRNAVVINVGRGAAIHDEAMIRCLQHGTIGGAILDVFHTEPLPPSHPYWTLPNCVVTPHIAGPSLPSEITACFVENFKFYEAGEPLLGLIDRERGY